MGYVYQLVCRLNDLLFAKFIGKLSAMVCTCLVEIERPIPSFSFIFVPRPWHKAIWPLCVCSSTCQRLMWVFLFTTIVHHKYMNVTRLLYCQPYLTTACYPYSLQWFTTFGVWTVLVYPIYCSFTHNVVELVHQIWWKSFIVSFFSLTFYLRGIPLLVSWTWFLHAFNFITELGHTHLYTIR